MSEVIGFVWVFGIVMAAISLIYIMGYPLLQESMDSSQFENMEQGFLVLQSSLKMVAFEQAPIKTTRIKLNGGSIGVAGNTSSNSGNINISINGSQFINRSLGLIEYEKNTRSIAFENGGVWERYSSGESVLLSKPRIFITRAGEDNVTMISLVEINGTDSSLGGTGVADIAASFKGFNFSYNKTEKVNVGITIYSKYGDAWKRYLGDEGFSVSGSSPINANLTNTRLIIAEYVIEARVS